MRRPLRWAPLALAGLLLAQAQTVPAQTVSAQTASAQTNISTAPLTIRFLDVGQGDAVLISTPGGQHVLYDGGRSESRMRELIRQYTLTRLSVVIASHGDADHITGLIPAVGLLQPRMFVNNGLAASTQAWERLVNVALQSGTPGLALGRGGEPTTLSLDGVRLTLLPPPLGLPDDEQNTRSIGLVIQYGPFRALMTGDSEPVQTNAWLRQYGGVFFGPTDVYKAVHHGAANGDTRDWIAAVRPKNVVIGVGPNNYGHPAASALDLYARAGAATWRTDLHGTVTVQVQASGRYTVTTERSSRAPVAPAPAPPVTVPRPSPAPATVPTPAPRPAPAAPVVAPAEVYFPNCAAVRAAGRSPLLRGQPGYRAGLDGDGDGRACE